MLICTFKNNAHADRLMLLSASVCQLLCVCWCVCVQLQTVPLCAHHTQTPCFLSCYDPETVTGRLCHFVPGSAAVSPLTSSPWDDDVAAVTGDRAKASDGGHWQCVCIFCCLYRGWCVSFFFFFLQTCGRRMKEPRYKHQKNPIKQALDKKGDSKEQKISVWDTHSHYFFTATIINNSNFIVEANPQFNSPTCKWHVCHLQSFHSPIFKR